MRPADTPSVASWRFRCPHGHVTVVARRGSNQHTAGAASRYYCKTCKDGDGDRDPHYDHVVDAKTGRRVTG